MIAWFCVLKIDSASDSHKRLLSRCYFLHLCCSVRPKKWQKAYLKLVVSGCKMPRVVGRTRGFAAFPRVVNNRGHLAVCQQRIVYLNLGVGGKNNICRGFTISQVTMNLASCIFGMIYSHPNILSTDKIEWVGVCVDLWAWEVLKYQCQRQG